MVKMTLKVQLKVSILGKPLHPTQCDFLWYLGHIDTKSYIDL